MITNERIYNRNCMSVSFLFTFFVFLKNIYFINDIGPLTYTGLLVVTIYVLWDTTL